MWAFLFGAEFYIAVLREKIDELDKQILDLLNERARIAQQIGEFKLKTGQLILDRDRETVIHNRMKALNKGPLADDNIRSIFTSIIIACRDLQTKKLQQENS